MIRVLLRADAHPAIGTGDLMSLVQFSRHPRVAAAGWECHFMVRDHPAARELLAARGIERAVFIDPGADAARESAAVARYAAALRMDAVLFEITERRLEAADLAGIDAVTAAVDFYDWIPPGLDLVVNWDTGATARYARAKHPGTEFFLGPEFVFLAPEFLDGSRRWQPEEEDGRPVVVAMGGADEFDVTTRIVSALTARTGPEVRLTAIVGAGYPRGGTLEALAERSSGRLTVRRNITDMAASFLNARHVFAAGGLTAYELVATGTPCSLVACYDHQVHRCRTFAQKGWARYLGFRTELEAVELPPSVREPLPAAPFVAGLSRVAAALEERVRTRRAGKPAAGRCA